VIRGRIVTRSALTAGDLREMYAIFSAHFEGVSRLGFERDLAEKSMVILLENGKLLGFSTLHVYQSHGVSVVYSGDTIVDQSHWGSSALATTWTRAVQQLRQQHPGDPMYWLLISSGFRTYRYLPTFWKTFSPRYDEPGRARLLDQLATERFGTAFRDGIVRFDQPQRLRPELRDVPPHRLDDPHIAFFVRQNPGHVDGDELACLTEIAPSNLTAAGRRMWDTARGRN
jgi:hypothetical protein